MEYGCACLATVRRSYGRRGHLLRENGNSPGLRRVERGNAVPRRRESMDTENSRRTLQATARRQSTPPSREARQYQGNKETWARRACSHVIVIRVSVDSCMGWTRGLHAKAPRTTQAMAHWKTLVGVAQAGNMQAGEVSMDNYDASDFYSVNLTARPLETFRSHPDTPLATSYLIFNCSSTHQRNLPRYPNTKICPLSQSEIAPVEHTETWRSLLFHILKASATRTYTQTSFCYPRRAHRKQASNYLPSCSMGMSPPSSPSCPNWDRLHKTDQYSMPSMSDSSGSSNSYSIICNTTCKSVLIKVVHWSTLYHFGIITITKTPRITHRRAPKSTKKTQMPSFKSQRRES
jgi:hypothetical protein